MKCITCKTEMKCKDDINNISTRIDFLVCPRCGAIAEVHYDTNSNDIIKLTWKRETE